ncbi:MAG: GNAT family N-acetyltransferase [Deinococcales bacterium]
MIQPHRPPEGMVVREPHGPAELRELEDLQIDVWGFDEREAVPAAHFRAVQHVGGMVLAAYLEDRLVGFAYGFPALPHDPWERGVGIHSHMVGVGRGRQGLGVGRVLKWAQRDWCLERGLTWMSWTFDPIQARNAKLNFHYLGALSHEYLVDFYGIMPGSLGGNQASDRLLVFWDLRSRGVAERAERFRAGLDPEPAPLPAGGWVLTRGADGEPEAHEVARDMPVLRVAVPGDATALMRDDPRSAARWRLAVREAMAPAVARGLVVRAFQDGAYLLERRERLESR